MEQTAMSNKRQRGMTLVELIIAMVIIAVALAGVLGVLSRTAVASADPMVNKQLVALAEGMMEEILLKPFGAPTATPPAACSRQNLASVGDYNGYNFDLCLIDGSPMPLLAGYRMQVTVAPGTGNILAGGTIPAGNVLAITVTVTRGAQNYTLRGWSLR
jgi:MSHA pilin protein MshD